MSANKVKIYQTKRNNSLVDVFKTETKIPTSLKIFFWILLGFGVDYGFSAMFKGRVKMLVKYSSMTISMTMVVILVSSFNFMYRDIWYWTTIAEGIVSYLILKRATYDVYDFLIDMHNKAEDTTAIHEGIFGIIISIYTFLMFFLKLIFSVYRCAYERALYCENTTDEHNAIYSLAYNTIDAIPVVHIVIFYYIYCHVKYLKESVKINFNVEKLTKRYVVIAECCEKIRPLYDQIILVGLFLNVPKFMSTAWFMILYINKNAQWYSCVSEVLLTFYLSSQIILPAILVQMVKCEIDVIKMVLNEEIMNANDEEERKIKKLLKYMKRRRLHHEVWGIIPTDLRLPLTLVSVCITYLIVIIQFAHLYD